MAEAELHPAPTTFFPSRDRGLAQVNQRQYLNGLHSTSIGEIDGASDTFILPLYSVLRQMFRKLPAVQRLLDLPALALHRRSASLQE